jgi:hypothetical protein
MVGQVRGAGEATPPLPLCARDNGLSVKGAYQPNFDEGKSFASINKRVRKSNMQAQAERARQARMILGDSERQVAEKFAEAAKSYANNPVAFHLRPMNMLYEGLKENATIVIVPSTAAETMELGGIAGMTALTMGTGHDSANRHKDVPPSRIPESNGI